MPSFFILEISVVRLSANRAAAPFAPPTTQLVSRRARMMASRSLSARVVVEGLETVTAADFKDDIALAASNPFESFNSLSGISSSEPRDKITARSMKFSNSRTLPGQ
jgi:hypothetical protein